MRHLHVRIAEVGVKHVDVAAQLKLHPSAFSAILSGRRRPPDGFEARVSQALDRLEAAERAASEARARVLAGKEGVA